MEASPEIKEYASFISRIILLKGNTEIMVKLSMENDELSIHLTPPELSQEERAQLTTINPDEHMQYIIHQFSSLLTLYNPRDKKTAFINLLGYKYRELPSISLVSYEVID